MTTVFKIPLPTSSVLLTNNAGAISQCKGLNEVHSTDYLFNRYCIMPVLPFSTTMADMTNRLQNTPGFGLSSLHYEFLMSLDQRWQVTHTY